MTADHIKIERLARPVINDAAMHEISALIRDASPDYFDLLFGGRENCLRKIAALARQPNSGFSTDRMVAAVEGAKIVGIALYMHGRELLSRQRADMLYLMKVSEPSDRIHVQANAETIRAMTPPVDQGEFYLRALAVSPDFRGLGIGGRLLEHYICDGVQSGAAYLRLDVREHNVAAIGMYRRHGFQVVKTHACSRTGWKLLSMHSEPGKRKA